MLEQARRQLVLYGRDGLPVVSHDGELRGWLTRADLLRALTSTLSSSEREIEEAAAAAESGLEDPDRPSTPLEGYEILELRIFADSPAEGRRVDEIDWPPGSTVVAVTQGREIHAARPDLQIEAGERVIVLAPIVERAAGNRTGCAGELECDLGGCDWARR